MASRTPRPIPKRIVQRKGFASSLTLEGSLQQKIRASEEENDAAIAAHFKQLFETRSRNARLARRMVEHIDDMLNDATSSIVPPDSDDDKPNSAGEEPNSSEGPRDAQRLVRAVSSSLDEEDTGSVVSVVEAIPSALQGVSKEGDSKALLEKYRGLPIPDPPAFTSSSLSHMMDSVASDAQHVIDSTDNVLRALCDPQQKQWKANTLDGEVERMHYHAQKISSWLKAAEDQTPRYYAATSTVLEGAHDEVVLLRGQVVELKERLDNLERQCMTHDAGTEALRKRQSQLLLEVAAKKEALGALREVPPSGPHMENSGSFDDGGNSPDASRPWITRLRQLLSGLRNSIHEDVKAAAAPPTPRPTASHTNSPSLAALKPIAPVLSAEQEGALAAIALLLQQLAAPRRAARQVPSHSYTPAPF